MDGTNNNNGSKWTWLGHQMTAARVEALYMVVTDMVLGLISVLLNLMVLTALREKPKLLGETHNLVLANICGSNLMAEVLVKSFSIVHQGHAVAARVLQSNIAFCTAYIFSYRATWATLPWSTALLAWIKPYIRIKHIQVRDVT